MAFEKRANKRLKRLERKTITGNRTVNATTGSGGGGITDFLELTDTPNTYTGASLQAVRVNIGETALEFYTPSSGGLTGSGTTNEIAYFTGASTLSSLTTATYPSLTELSYVKGVTSSIQTQLNGKLGTGLAWLAASGATLTGNNTITGTGYTLKGVWTSLGTTQTDGYGLWLSNTTSATSGNQQISPSLVLEGQGWKTNATAGSQSVKWSLYTLPIQGASAPSSVINFNHSVNGGAYTTIGSIGINDSAGFHIIFNSAGRFLGTRGANELSIGSFLRVGTDVARNLAARLNVQSFLNDTSGNNYTIGIGETITNGNPTTTTIHIVGIVNTYNLTGTFTGKIYGVNYDPTNTSLGGATEHLAWRNTSGSVLIGHTTLGASTTRLQVRGIDDTTGKIILSENNSGTERFSQLGNGKVNFTQTWTATANNENGGVFSGTITARGTASDTVSAYTNTSTLVAAANSQVLIANDIVPTFTNGAFTSVVNIGQRVYGTNVCLNLANSVGSVNLRANTSSSGYLTVSNSNNSSALMILGTVFMAGVLSGENPSTAFSSGIHVNSSNATVSNSGYIVLNNGSRSETSGVTNTLYVTSSGYASSGNATHYTARFRATGGSLTGTFNGVINIVDIKNSLNDINLGTHKDLTFSGLISQNLSSTSPYTAITGEQTYNQSHSSATGTLRFIYYNPTLTSVKGLHYLIQSTSGAVDIADSARSQNWSSILKTTAGAHTGLTAATEFVSQDFTGATWTWADGTVTTQRFNYFRGYTLNKTTTSATFTDAYNVYVDDLTAGAGVTITNKWSLGLAGNLKVSGTRVNMANLPTSSAGLATGDIWNNAGVLSIV